MRIAQRCSLRDAFERLAADAGHLIIIDGGPSMHDSAEAAIVEPRDRPSAGRRGVQRLLMGSDAAYIVRHSSVPVLLLRGHSED